MKYNHGGKVFIGLTTSANFLLMINENGAKLGKDNLAKLNTMKTIGAQPGSSDMWQLMQIVLYKSLPIAILILLKSEI